MPGDDEFGDAEEPGGDAKAAEPKSKAAHSH
jgi:hypothetical protein